MPELAPAALAADLARAFSDGVAVSPPSEAGAALDLEGAYEAQDEMVRLLAEGATRPAGYKAGATSLAALSELGLERPVFGRVFASEATATGVLRLGERIAPRAEPEIALLLEDEIAEPRAEDVWAAAASVHVALDLADSRIAGWAGGLTDLVADCAAGGTFALGPSVAPEACADLGRLEVSLASGGERRGSGPSAALSGGPLGVAAELAAWCAARGLRLGAGDVVLTGALAPPVGLRSGDRVRASCPALGEVEIIVE